MTRFLLPLMSLLTACYMQRRRDENDAAPGDADVILDDGDVAPQECVGESVTYADLFDINSQINLEMRGCDELETPEGNPLPNDQLADCYTTACAEVAPFEYEGQCYTSGSFIWSEDPQNEEIAHNLFESIRDAVPPEGQDDAHIGYYTTSEGEIYLGMWSGYSPSPFLDGVCGWIVEND